MADITPQAHSSTEILLVEDDPNDLELTLYALKKHDLAHRVQVVRDGAEALNFIFCQGEYSQRPPADTPKLILLDLKLPKVGGLEVLQQLKSTPQTQLIPIVVLTSSRDEYDVTESYRRGANSYLVKSVNFEEFTRMIGQVARYWLVTNLHPPIGLNH